jgi:penicillin amidase
VLYDAHGVPHVRAGTDADAFLAQGLCQALDRGFQMDLMRRALSGRLAEMLGERPLGDLALPPFGRDRTTTDADRLLRVLDLVGAARRTLERADPGDRRLLDAFVAGVNAGFDILRRKRPLEFRLARIPVEPWNAQDSVLLAKGMALGLSFKWRSAPVFAAVAEALGDRPDRLAALLPGDGSGAQARHLADGARGIAGALPFLPWAPAVGSNAFLIGGGHTRSGGPILASDPHLELSLPSVWYLAGVRGDRYRAVGATLPGVPGVVIGRTPTLAWGLTNGMIDDADLWRERVEGSRYLVDGVWRPLVEETQEIRRRGAAPVLFRLRRTHRGPLLSDAFPGYEGPPLSIRLSFHEPAGEMEAFLALGRARRASEVPAGVASFGSPCQNLVYADGEGGAGYRLIGRVPLRSRPHHPALPRDGTDSSTDWTGWLPAEEIPATPLGPMDRFATANHPHRAGSDPYFSHLYEPPYRALRIHERLSAIALATAADAAAVQRDAKSLAATAFRRVVLLPHVEAARRARPSVGRALDLLLAWDGDESPAARGAALWHFTYHRLIRRVFGASLPEPVLEAWMGLVNLVDAALLSAFADAASPWAAPSVRPTLLAEAVEDAVETLAARGLPPDAPWGVVHTLTLRHPLGGVPLLAPTWNRGPIPAPGGPYAVTSGQYRHSRPAAVGVGPSYRQVIDLADPEGSSRMITFGGQSGSVSSPHYDDLTPLWLDGRFIPMPLDTDPSPAERLTLLPG